MRNGALRNVPRLVKETAGFGGKYIYFSAATQDLGTTQDRSTGSGYPRQTGRIYVYYPMIVSAIIWDVRNADTYICRFVTTAAGTTVAFTIAAAVVVGGAGSITITPDAGDFLLMPGPHYLQMITHDAGNTTWYDKNAIGQNYTYYYSLDIYYTAARFDYTIPMQLRARPLVFANMTEYAK